MSKKLGKSADDIFSRKPIQQEKPSTITPEIESKTHLENTSTTKQEGLSNSPRGRPVEHKEGWSKVTVVLLDKQIHWLDQLASTIRLNTKAAVSRAELIRATLAAVEESGIDLSHLKSEADIKEIILDKLKK